MFICLQEEKMDTNSVDILEGKKRRETADCSAYIIHPDRVETARSAAVAPALIGELEALFKVFSDATRLRILGALVCGELCVCDVGAVLGMSQSAVSHQLAVLRASRLVTYRREGKTVYYSLADDHVARLLEMGLEHASERA